MTSIRPTAEELLTRSRALPALSTFASILAASALLAACGGSEPAVGGAAKAPVPEALHAAESAAEDVIDLALAGDRKGVVARAAVLHDTARGDAAAAARAAGVPGEVVDGFVARAADVARLAADAPLVDVGLAAQRAFVLVPELLRPFDEPVPVEVLELDALDFGAKLSATAGDQQALARTVAQLGERWSELRVEVGDRNAAVAKRYDEHVDSLAARAASADLPGAIDEAQRGLDLVDLIEQAYLG